MSPKPRIIYEYPNEENTIPFTEYQSSSPEKFSLPDDKFVIYAGGNNYSLSILDKDPNNHIIITHELQGIDQPPVSLFILNTGVIIWSCSLNKGIELPYQCVLLHALQGSKLYLQISCSEIIGLQSMDLDDVLTVDLELELQDGLQQSTGIFNGVPCDMESVYLGMSKCSDMHFDDNDSESNEFEFDVENSSLNGEMQMPALEIPNHWITGDNVALHNSGDADDLEDIEPEDHRDDEAGMHVDIGYGPTAGAVRRRDSDDDEFKKSRRV